MRTILSVLVVLALSNLAHAQRAPDMATLDRGDGISKIAVDGGLVFGDYPYDLALRLELYGQYVHRSGFGIYGAVPLTMSFGAPDDTEDPVPPDLVPNDALSISNPEVGGMYVVTKSRKMSFVFRLGASLPVASEGRDEFATRTFGIYPRATDLANAFGNWYLRFGFSPLLYVDRFFFRFDLGFDAALEEFDPHILRFNLGGGVDLGPVALSLELVNSALFYEGDDDMLNVLAFTLRFMGDKLQPYLSVGAPLDSGSDNIDLFVAGGIQFVP
jgi:hypothetical protein